jgi:outer membrane protein assembly factor BamB
MRAVLHLLVANFVICAVAGAMLLAEVPLGSAEFRASAQHPVGWRGDGSGRFPGARPVTQWSMTKNVRWHTVVGTSYSSPIATDNAVVVTSEPNLLVCVDRTSGKVLWKARAEPGDLTNEKERQAAGEYKPPKDGSGMAAATPLCDGTTVYAVFGNGIVMAVDMEGKRKWAAFIDAEQSTGYGRSASPIVVGGKLIVHMTNLYALDPTTGKRLWVNTQAQSSYGTPVGFKVGEVDLIVTPAGDLVRAADGKNMGGDLAMCHHSSPIAEGNKVYFGDSQVTALGFDAELKGKELWSGVVPDDVIGSPVLSGDILFMVSGKGELYAFDAGKEHGGNAVIEARPLFPNAGQRATPVTFSSLTLGGKYLFLSSNTGETVVLEATREAKEVGRNRIKSGAGGSPFFAGGEMFLRDGEELYCIGE